MKISEFKQLIREEISSVLNENDKSLTKEELLLLNPGDKFFRYNGLSYTESEVLSNSKKELKFKSNIPGLGWQPGWIIYKNWDNKRDMEVFRVNNSLDWAKYYRTKPY